MIKDGIRILKKSLPGIMDQKTLDQMTKLPIRLQCGGRLLGSKARVI